MASPQAENGYTRISNELLDALAQCQIPSDSYQLFIAIIRYTYGWGRKTCQLSTTQLMMITGLNKRAVHKARSNLVDSNLITVHKKEYSQILSYSVQKDYEKWKLYTKKGIHKKVYSCTQSGSDCTLQGVQTVPSTGDSLIRFKERKKERTKKEGIELRSQDLNLTEPFKTTPPEEFINLMEKLKNK